MSEVRSARNMIVFLAILIEGGLVLISLALGWLFDHRPLERFALSLPGALMGLAGAVPIVAMFFVIFRWPVGPLGGLKRFSEQVIRPLMAPCSLTDLVGISCLAGLGEEMLFRGLIQDLVAGPLGAWGALALASVLFGLLHAISLTYAVVATLMGAYLGGLYLLTGNLLVPVIAHALYDLVVLVWLLYGPGAAEFFEAAEQEAREGEAGDGPER
jgi:membrane protease YdiL (CAAX protease family)